MCQLVIGRIGSAPNPIGFAPNPIADLRMLEWQAAEQRVAQRTIRRHKNRVLDKAAGELARELRRLYRREAGRVLSILRSARLPYTARQAQEQLAPLSPDQLYELLLNGVDLTGYEAALVEAYQDVMAEAMQSVVDQAARGVGLRGGELMRFPQAQRWLKAHSIEFGRKFAGTVTASTNEAIRAQLAQGWQNFEGIDRLIERVQSVYDTAERYRAEMIARTEGNRAYSAATMEMGRELGASMKFWIVSGSPYSLVDVCGENANLGTIPIGGSFADIEGLPIDAPPAHPNCLCDVGYEFADDWQVPEELTEV